VVIKGASRRNIGFWAGHLRDTKKNDRAEIVDKRGLIADDLRGMMREMRDDATGTRCQNFMYIASFNPCENETLTEQQWQRAFEIFEKERGIPEGQPRIVIEHEKKGRVHRHVVWDRIDTEKMRAFPDSLDLKVCEAAKHEIERELGLQRTPGLLNRDPALPPPQRNPPSWEMFRGQKSGIDPRDLKAEVTAIFRESGSAGDFIAGLEAHGYQLCQGDRRGFVILDRAGDTHSLARRLDGINAKQLAAFMDGVDRAALPGVSQAREKHQDRKIAGLEEDRATVRREIEWEEALARAAIAKEEKERRFVAPKPERAAQKPARETSAPAKASAQARTAAPPRPQPAPARFREAARATTAPRPAAPRKAPAPAKPPRQQAANDNRPRAGAIARRGLGAATRIAEKTLSVLADGIASLFAPPTPKGPAQIADDERRAASAANDHDRAWEQYLRATEHERAKAREQDEARQRETGREQYERLQRERGGRER